MKRLGLVMMSIGIMLMLWKGEALFYRALEGWLALNGIYKEEVRFGGSPKMVWYEGGRENEHTVVLLHGVGGDALTSWFRLMPELVDKYHVVAPNLVFAGLGDLVGSGYHINYEQSYVRNLLTYLKVDKLTLAALSFGAWPALQVATDSPEMVEGLVLISPLGPEGVESVKALAQLSDNPGKEFYYRIFEKVPPIPESFLELHWNRTSRVIEALPQFWGQLEDVGADLKLRLRRVRCPVLILFGENDGILPRQQFLDLAKQLPGSEVGPLPDTGHAVVWDNPGQLENELNTFLETQVVRQ